MTSQLLAWYTAYGLWVLAAVLGLAALGAPLPASLLLLFTGGLIHESQMSAWTAVPTALVAVVVGDHLGYFGGRLGGGRISRFLARLVGGRAKLEAAEAKTRKLGFAGVFLSRWLLTALGPAVNITSGLARYPLAKYTAAEVSGELVWIGLYLGAGYYFYDRIQTAADMLSNFSAALGALGVAALLAWYLVRSRRRRSVQRAEVPVVHGPEVVR